MQRFFAFPLDYFKGMGHTKWRVVTGIDARSRLIEALD